MKIANHPFKSIDSRELAENIKSACPEAEIDDILAFVEGEDMRIFNAASIYHLAVRKFS